MRIAQHLFLIPHLFLVSLFLIGCGQAAGGGGGNLCTPGATQVCACLSGQQGVQLCDQNGHWAGCQCTDDPSDPIPWPDAGATQGDQGTLQTGALSCTEIYSCFYSSQCSQNDTACYNACISQGTATAQQQYNAVATCEYNASCSQCTTQANAACYSCLEQACSQQYSTCGFIYSCAQVVQCTYQCSQNDESCYTQCASKATMTGYLTYSSLWTCWDNAYKGSCQSSCGTWDQSCSNCVNQACASEAQACGIS